MLTIYHNPRCSKSRNTLALIQENDIEPTVVRYLDEPPSAEELQSLLGLLGIPARALLRKNEDAYKTLNLSDSSLSDDTLIKAMVDNPKLIERPIVSNGKQAILGRPPENVLQLLKN